MQLEGGKKPRTPEQFLMQASAVHDPLLTDLATVENFSPRGAPVATGYGSVALMWIYSPTLVN